MLLIAPLLRLVLAGAPPVLLAQPVAADQPQAWRELVQAEGGSAARAALSCRAMVPEIALCFRYLDEGRLRWVTGEELARWGLTLEEVERLAAGALSQSPWTPQPVEGGGTWFLSSAEQGREATVLLHPEWLDAIGPGARVALPAQGVVMAWAAGDPQLDQAASVAVRKAWEDARVPISPVVLVWEGGRLRTWAEAVPRR